MTRETDRSEAVRHVLISNSAFTKLTGVRKVCMVCGAPDPGRTPCPGKRAER